jgi:hypothetical protein
MNRALRMGFSVVGAGLLSLLAGCATTTETGGGGDVAPNPYATLDQLTGNQTFQSAQVRVQRDAAGAVSATGAESFGNGIALSYDAAADSYTVSNAGTKLDSFAPSDLQASSTSSSRVYQKTAGSGTAALTVARGVVGGVPLSYTQFTTYVAADATGQRQWISVGGQPTLGPDMPTAGTGTYTTAVSGTVVRDGKTYVAPAASSTATFTADFGARTVATTVHLIGSLPTTPETTVDFGTVTGAGVIERNASGFTGAFTGTTGAGFAGVFTGSAAQEMGYVFSYGKGADQVTGTVAGRKN